MNSKSLLIAVAALALTATSAQAFNSQILIKADLSEEQRAAFEEARELQAEGDTEAAKEVLVEAGIDEEVIERVRYAMTHREGHWAIHKALEAEDYEAFIAAIAGSPLADLITSEEDFEQFLEAHKLREEGEHAAAAKIFTDMGLPPLGERRGHGRMFGGPGKMMAELSESEKEAFLVAKQANDHDAMKAVLIEAGVIDEDAEFPLWQRGPKDR